MKFMPSGPGMPWWRRVCVQEMGRPPTASLKCTLELRRENINRSGYKRVNIIRKRNWSAFQFALIESFFPAYITQKQVS